MPFDSTLAERFDLLLSQAQRVFVACHLNPDGDALGSALAMSQYLQHRGVPHEVLCNNDAPFNLKFLPGVTKVTLQPKGEQADVAIVLDLDSFDRLGRVRPYIEAADTVILIDHHVPHEAQGDLRIVNVESPATALIVHQLFKAVGYRPSTEAATCLLTGIVTDTGSFRFRNTTAEALHASAELLECGGDLALVGREVYMNRPLKSIELVGRTLSNMQLDMDGKLAWSVLTIDDFSEFGAEEQHTEGLANELLSIDTVHIAVIIRQPTTGKVRASIRSREPYDVSKVAQKFGGGGHRNAAGCTFDLPIEQAENELIEEIKKCLESC